MNVSPKGTIIVAGFGEFTLAGMSPTEAAEKLSAAMRGRNASSKGVEIRRHVEAGKGADQARLGDPREPQSPSRTPPQVPPTDAVADGKVEPMLRPERPTTPKPGETPPANAPASPPAPVAGQSFAAPLSEDDFVDLVIVVQKDVAAGQENR